MAQDLFDLIYITNARISVKIPITPLIRILCFNEQPQFSESHENIADTPKNKNRQAETTFSTFADTFL